VASILCTDHQKKPKGAAGIEMEARHSVLAQVGGLERRPLLDLDDVPGAPGVYFLFRAPARRGSTIYDRLYRPFASGERALYVGKVSSAGLDERLAWHLAGIIEAEGLEARDMYRATLACGTGAWASFIEAVCLEEWSSTMPWNRSGFGSRNPGRARFGQPPSKFDCLHPGRYWATGRATDAERALAALHVAYSGSQPLPVKMRWGPIER
jgi:hypothetical protein